MSDLIPTDGSSLPEKSRPAPPDGFLVEERELDLRRVWAIVRKRLWLIVLSVACVTIPSMVFTFLTTPVYRSTATIQIDPESAKVLPYREVSDSVVNPSPDYELHMKTQVQVLGSSALATRTIERLRPLPEARQHNLEGAFDANLQVQRIEGSQVVMVSYDSPSPLFSALVANAVVEEFIRLYFEKKNDTTRRARQFLESQLEELRDRVESAEAELIRYAKDHQILNIDNKQEEAVRQRFGVLTGELTKSEGEVITKKAAYEGILAVRPEAMPESLKGPLIASLEAQHVTIEQELTRLLFQFGENWPEVVRKQEDLKLAKQQLAVEKAASLARAQRQAELEYTTARSQHAMLARALGEQQAAVNALNEASVRYNTLKREVDTNKQLYEALLQRLKETGVTANMEFGNIHVASPATPSDVPFRPRKLWNFLLALMAGLSIGGGLTALLEYLDNTVKSPEELERLGLPSLGWVPVIGSHNGQTKALADDPKNCEMALAAPDRSKFLVKREATNRVSADWRVWECFRTLCTSIMLSRGDRPAQSILISSALPQEGKTTITAYLGVALAEAGARTIMLEADFRKPTLARRFGLSESTGLSVFLAGGECRICNTFHPNLHIMPSGPIPPSPLSLFNSVRFEKLLKVLATKYQFVLIDSPPLLSLADAVLIASKTDGTILVVRSGTTPNHILRKAISHVRRAGASVLGAAVNRFDLSNPEYSYYRHYYYDDSYRTVGKGKRAGRGNAAP